MFFIGLGSNLGNRERHLRRAIQRLTDGSTPLLRNFRQSSLYQSDAMLPPSAPTDWNAPYLNLVICGESDLEPLDFLKEIKNIEKSLGRSNHARWSPREIDIDILACNDSQIDLPDVKVPHPGLLERPFALLPFAELAPEWKYPGGGPPRGKTATELAQKWLDLSPKEIPFSTRSLGKRFFWPQLVGILNVTPDSFSDGGKCISPTDAVDKARALGFDGAEVIDVGAESTRPGATLLSHEEEWIRLEPVLKQLSEIYEKFSQGPMISIDTRHPQTAEKALRLGVHWINDVSACEDPKMLDVVKHSTCDLVFMHNLGIPPSPKTILSSEKNPVSEVYDWALRKIDLFERKGISRDRLIFDPGIGFGKSPNQSLKLIKGISHFADLGLRILVGHSRKSFLNHLTQRPFAERDVETLTISLALAKKGIDYLRVHNVGWHARGLTTAEGLAVEND